MKHTFQMNLDWTGGRNDVGTIEAERLKTQISIPPEMDGPGIGTNPDEMLLGAAATCYIITLAAMLGRSELPHQGITIDAEGIVDVTNGVFTYETIRYTTRINVPKTATDRDITLVERITKKAKDGCMISRALAGNVAFELDTTVTRVV
ncbi:SACOL1771 family peroxiredoxin [Exiguobacterium sp. s16]|uniref:SACOL1771 family peroxiredoxin n=1 Tax=Exiguobacterium sp. s16 TaxID=2751237 RepID=UPI001BEBEF8F|nr:SACOL1771 family peroxiredoxin [Exiguobacterium sp. s16]